MTKLLGLHPERTPDNVWVIPGSGVVGSMPPDAGFQTNPAVNGIAGSTKIFYYPNPNGANKRFPEARGMLFGDYAGRTISARNYWKFNRYPNENLALPLTTYSCRFYYTGIEGGYVDAFPHMISFMLGGPTGVDRFSMMLDQYPQWFESFPDKRPFFKGATNSDYLTTAGSDTFSLYPGPTWRIEIQVMSTPVAPVTQKVVVKIYNWNATTPVKTYSFSPPNVSADCLMLGRHPTKSGGSWLIGQYWIGDVELFNTYDLDGTAGQHRQTPKNLWFEKINGVEVPVLEEGTKKAGVVVTADKNNWNDDAREFKYGTSNYTVSSYYYDGARTIRNGLIYIPTRAAPSGGWPVISFWHGGFYAGGTLNDINMDWVRWLLWSGFAVTTGEWIVGQAMINLLLGLGTWPNANSGRYPSFVIDPKLHQLYLMAHGRDGDSLYNINTNKTCIVGHSAGAGIAGMAAVSRDLILPRHPSIGGSWDLTVNNPTYGYRTATPDPTFTCCYLYSAPTDMKWAFDNDPTHPNFGAANQAQGVLRATANTYMGYPWDHVLTDAEMVGTRTTEMIAAQDPAKIPPIGMVTGIADGVVPYNHTKLLVAAALAKGKNVSQIYTNMDHDHSYSQGPETHFMDFLTANGMR